MEELEILLNRIRKVRAEQAAGVYGTPKPGKATWREVGFQDGLEWVETEIADLVYCRGKKENGLPPG
jgi:hypothetical protein